MQINYINIQDVWIFADVQISYSKGQIFVSFRPIFEPFSKWIPVVVWLGASVPYRYGASFERKSINFFMYIY